MRPLYMKGNYEGKAAFVKVTVSSSKVIAEMILYSERDNKWISQEKKFYLRDINQMRGYHNFKELFFESNSREYNSVRKFLLNPPPKIVTPKKSIEPIITVDELLDIIKQFEDSKKKKNGD